MNSPRHSPISLAAVLLGHAGVVLAIVAKQPLQQPVAAPQAISINLIEMPEAVVKRTESQPPRPQVKPQLRPPVLTSESPSAPLAPMLADEPPRPAIEPVPVASAAAVAPAPPLVEPRLDAAYLNNPKPPYPALSRRLGEQGAVQLRVFVNADGSVARLELKRSSGFARLDQSAIDTVRNWRFVAARQGGQPVAAWVVVPIQFTLGS